MIVYIRNNRVIAKSDVIDSEIRAIAVQVPDNENVSIGDIYNEITGAFTREIKPVINFSYPVSAAVAANIIVHVSVVNAADAVTLPVNQTYYVPLVNMMSGALEQMLTVPIVNGEGSVNFSASNPGIYGIGTDLIRPRPTALFSETPDIAVY